MLDGKADTFALLDLRASVHTCAQKGGRERISCYKKDLSSLSCSHLKTKEFSILRAVEMIDTSKENSDPH